MPQEADAELVNISMTGLLAETMARLAVGSPVQVHFVGRFSPALVDGRIARCEVACMGRDGFLRYNIAVEFDAPIALDEAVEPVPPALDAPEAPSVKAVRNRW